MGRVKMTDKTKQETLFKFPCEYPLKIMGKNDPELVSFVKKVMNTHVEGLTEHAFTDKTSKHGRFQSITVTFTAASKEQLDAIYSELTDSDFALYVL